MEPSNYQTENTNELVRFMKLHNLGHIEDVLKLPLEDVYQMDGCGMRLLIEVYRFKEGKL